MKVCLAALIPLLVFLIVLPSDVSARRRIRQKLERKEDEYDVSHIIRKRSEKLSAHFKGSDLPVACAVCGKLYSIDEESCVAGKKKSKYNCMLKAKGDKSAFMAKFHEMQTGSGGGGGGSPEGGGGGAANPAPAAAAAAEPAAAEKPAEGGGGKPQTKDEYFNAQNIEKTCKVCKVIANVNAEECVKPEENHDNKCCKHAFDVLKSKFDEEWNKQTRRRRVFRKRKFNV